MLGVPGEQSAIFALDCRAAPKTLECYDGVVLPFLGWLDGEGVQRFGWRSDRQRWRPDRRERLASRRQLLLSLDKRRRRRSRRDWVTGGTG
jgi:hypothetical protein